MIVPSTWTYIKSQGIDSFIGDIRISRKEMVHFDFGLYSNDLEYPLWTGGHDIERERVKTDQHFVVINGFKAKVVSHKFRNRNDLGIHFNNLSIENKDRQLGDDVLEFSMYGVNVSSARQRELRQVFQTTEFIQHEK